MEYKFKPENYPRCSKCRRVMKFVWRSQKDVGFVCHHGKKDPDWTHNEKFERPATTSEKRQIKKCDAEMRRHCTLLHARYRHFMKPVRPEISGPYLMKGWPLMEYAEDYAKRHPDVMIAGVDDNHFTGSSLVFVPHEAGDEYMGTTVMFVPQCSGEDPVEFFLYKCHLQGIEKVLSVLRRRHRTHPYCR